MGKATKIFFDESGFTGDDLLNPEQPYFCVASSIIGDDEASDLLRHCFPRYRANEFKFTAIWRRESHRAGLREFARALPKLSERVFVWIIDKRFCLLTKMVDYLVEPLAYGSGFDFYKDGWAQRYLNTVHQDILRYGSEELYSATVTVWDRLARYPSPESLAAVKNFLRTESLRVSPPIDNLYKLLHRGAEYFEAGNKNIEDFRDTNEIQLTSVLTSVIHWRQRRSEAFEIAHDASSNFFKQRDLWSAATRNDLSPREHLLGDGSTVQFPLRVQSTNAVFSENSAAIQLCDVMAGLFAKAARGFEGRPIDSFMAELIMSGVGEASFSGVIPRDERQNGPAARRDGPDVVDAMVDILAPAIGRPSK